MANKVEIFELKAKLKEFEEGTMQKKIKDLEVELDKKRDQLKVQKTYNETLRKQWNDTKLMQRLNSRLSNSIQYKSEFSFRGSVNAERKKTNVFD